MTRDDIGAAVAAALVVKRRSPKSLRRRVYRAVYAAAWDGRRKEPGLAESPAVDRSFTEWIRDRSEGVREESGWAMRSAGAAGILLERDGVRALAQPEEVRGMSNPTDDVVVVTPAISNWRIPGFVARWNLDLGESDLVRIYLNLKPPQVIWLLTTVAAALHDKKMPFFMKTLAHPGRYYRADTGLVMVPSERESEACDVISDCRRAEGIRLSPAVPLLTSRQNPGIGLADDPNDLPLFRGRRGSHGEWVTQWLLEAISDTDDLEEATTRMISAISAAGRDPRRPYRRGETSSSGKP